MVFINGTRATLQDINKLFEDMQKKPKEVGATVQGYDQNNNILYIITKN